MNLPRERDRLPDVRQPADPRDGALEAEPEARVHERAVSPKVEVPVVRLRVESLLLDAGQQLVVVVLALRAADDLAVPLGRQQSSPEHRARVVGVLLHVERLRFLRVVEDEHRPVVVAATSSASSSAPRSLAPLDVGPDRVAASPPRRCSRFAGTAPAPARAVPVSRSSSASSLRPPLEARADDVGHELFLEPHVVVGVVERDLGLDHPELGQVPARLRLLGAEGRAEAVDLPERGRRRLAIQLTRLREVGVSRDRSTRWRKVAGFLADRAGQDRRVDREKPRS